MNTLYLSYIYQLSRYHAACTRYMAFTSKRARTLNFIHMFCRLRIVHNYPLFKEIMTGRPNNATDGHEEP